MRGAQEVFDTWRADFEPRFRSGDYPAAIESHFMKYRSLFASLALIFEVITFVDGQSSGKAISNYSAVLAVMWCDYLESHAKRMYSPLTDTTAVAAVNLLRRIKDGDVEHGTKVRDIYNKQWGGLTNRDEAAKAIQALEEHGWVRLVKAKPPGGGRPSEVIHIHPELRE